MAGTKRQRTKSLEQTLSEERTKRKQVDPNFTPTDEEDGTDDISSIETDQNIMGSVTTTAPLQNEHAALKMLRSITQVIVGRGSKKF